MTDPLGEWNIGESLVLLSSRLKKTSETADLDSQILLAQTLDKPRSWVLAHPEQPLNRESLTRLEKLASRLEAGEPLPYVLGRWFFFGLELEVSPDVLIPRPETELLVEKALAWLQTRLRRRQVADVGTGTGCIGIALAVNVPDLHVEASDISPSAVALAGRNAARYGLHRRMEINCGDLLSGNSNFDLIVANLPYIPSSTLHDLPIYGREPAVALDGGADGLELIRRLLVAAPAHLLPGGMVLIEIEASEGPAALSLAGDIFPSAQIQVHRDLSGHDRLLEIQD